MSNSIPSARSPLVGDETGTMAPSWYRFFAESVPPKGALVMWNGEVPLPAGYVSIGTLAVDGWSSPLHIITKGTPR